MRLYFHLADDDEVIRDLEGVEIDDLNQARVEALSALCAMRDELGFGDWSGWRLDVTNADGAVVLSFDLGDMTTDPAGLRVSVAH